MLYVAGRTLSGGRAEGVASSLGTGLGGPVHVAAAAAAIGLSALIAASSEVLTVLKYAGALYLIYLGIQAWRAPDPTPHASAATIRARLLSSRAALLCGLGVSLAFTRA